MTIISVAYVLLEAPSLPDETALIRTLRARHPELQWSPSGLTPANSTDDPMLIRAGDQLMAVLMMPAPVPPDHRVRQRASWLWPDAPSAIGRHRAHLVVAPVGAAEDKPETRKPGFFENAQLTTAVVGAIVATLRDVVAVVWLGHVARSPEMWLEQSRDAFSSFPDQPFGLWIEIVPYRSGKTIGAYTLGLSAFAGREIEFEADGLARATVTARVAQLSAYIIGHGLDDRLKSGTVFEADSEIDHCVQVLHRNSRFKIGPVVSFSSLDDRAGRSRTYPIIPAAIAHHHPLLIMLSKVGLFDLAGTENQISLKPDHYTSDVRLETFDQGLSRALSKMMATDSYAEADDKARLALASGNTASARSILEPWGKDVALLQRTIKMGLTNGDLFLFMPAPPAGA